MNAPHWSIMSWNCNATAKQSHPTLPWFRWSWDRGGLERLVSVIRAIDENLPNAKQNCGHKRFQSGSQLIDFSLACSIIISRHARIWSRAPHDGVFLFHEGKLYYRFSAEASVTYLACGWTLFYPGYALPSLLQTSRNAILGPANHPADT